MDITLNEFLAVFDDSSYKLFESKNQALSVNPLFIAEAYIHSDRPTWGNPDRKKYSFKIFDSSDKPYDINCDGWRIKSIVKYFYYKSHTEVKVVSPDGEIRILDTGDTCSLISISKLLQFINQFRGFKDWTYYELSQENKRLKQEIQDLKFELEE